MSVQRKKSKRQSGANFKSPPEEITLFLHRNLGKHIIAMHLLSQEIEVEVHDDHLPQDAPDEAWIALVGRMRWVAITKDKNILYRKSELDSIKQHAARVIVIRMKNATGPEIAKLLAAAKGQIARFVAKTSAPFVAGIYKSKTIRSFSI